MHGPPIKLIKAKEAQLRWEATLVVLRDLGADWPWQYPFDWKPLLSCYWALPLFGGRVGAARCDYCRASCPGAPGVALREALRVAPVDFRVFLEHDLCMFGFLNGCAAAHAFFGALYVVLRLGLEDEGSPLCGLPRDVFGRLWYRHVLGRPWGWGAAPSAD